MKAIGLLISRKVISEKQKGVKGDVNFGKTKLRLV